MFASSAVRLPSSTPSQAPLTAPQAVWPRTTISGVPTAAVANSILPSMSTFRSCRRRGRRTGRRYYSRRSPRAAPASRRSSARRPSDSGLRRSSRSDSRSRQALAPSPRSVGCPRPKRLFTWLGDIACWSLLGEHRGAARRHPLRCTREGTSAVGEMERSFLQFMTVVVTESGCCRSGPPTLDASAALPDWSLLQVLECESHEANRDQLRSNPRPPTWLGFRIGGRGGCSNRPRFSGWSADPWNGLGLRLATLAACSSKAPVTAGQLRYRVEAPHPYPYNLCYCTACRKTAGGGGYAINLAARSDTLVVEGEQHVGVYPAWARRRARRPTQPATAPLLSGMWGVRCGCRTRGGRTSCTRTRAPSTTTSPSLRTAIT